MCGLFQGKGELFTYFLIGDGREQTPRGMSFDSVGRSTITSMSDDGLDDSVGQPAADAGDTQPTADNVFNNAAERANLLPTSLTDISLV